MAGGFFRWSWMWGRIAAWFELEPAPFDGIVQPLETQMANDAAIWRRIAEREGLHAAFGFPILLALGLKTSEKRKVFRR